MNVKRVFVLSAMALIITLGILHFQSGDNGGVHSPTYIKIKKPTQKAAIGNADDPNSRTGFEFLKIRDPKTNVVPQNIREKELQFAETLPVRGEGEPLWAKRVGNRLLKITAAQWSLRGPKNAGGRTRALGIDVTNENVILAGGVSGGIWRSEDGGSTWTKTTASDQLHSISCLVQDTRTGKTNIWYAGTGEYRGNSASGYGAPYRGDGIYKSTDGGASWTLLASTATNKPQSFDNFFDYVWNIVVDVSNTQQDEVYAATYSAIFRSTDGGQNWQFVLGPSDNDYSAYVDVAITSTGVLYATLSSDGSKKGIWRSVDGVNWVNITPGGFPSTYRRIVIGIAPSNENIVYFLGETPGAGTNDHSLWKYEYVSGDGSGSGGNWTNLSGNIPVNNSNQVGNYDSQSSYDMLIKVKPDDENTVIIGGTNLYISTDGFSTTNWKWIGGYTTTGGYGWYPGHHPDQHALVFYPSDPKKALSGHDGGVSRTSNITAALVSWESLNRGYYTTQFYAVAVDTAVTDDPTIIGGMQDNGTWLTFSSNVNTDWIRELGGDGGFCAITKNGGYYYMSWQNGTIFRVNLDGDGNWTNWAQVDPAGRNNHFFINPFTLDAVNQKIMYYGGDDAVWRNSDLTAIPAQNQTSTSVNWTKLTATQISSGQISALRSAMDRTLYYGTSAGQVFRLDNAHTSTGNPVNITGSGFPSNAYVSSIAVNPNNSDEVVVVFSNYNVISVWYSANRGASWSNISGNLEENPDGSGSGPSVRWVEIIPLSNKTVYMVGTSTGVYSTSEINGTGTVWVQEAPSVIGNVVVDMLASRPKEGLVVAGTHGTGAYSTVLDETVGIADEPAVVQEFRLEQNYPNPFNPSTTIRYQLPEAAEVELNVYDASGRKVVTLARGYQIAGTHSVQWNGRDRFGRLVASGVYLYELKAGSFRDVKRMTFVR